MRRLMMAGLLACLGLASPAWAQTPASETYINSAENRARNGDVDGAVADLTRAVALDPKNADVYRYRGLLRVRNGNNAPAIADFTQAIALDGKKAENYLYRSTAKRQNLDIDGAIADARKAVELDPKLELAHETLFKTYLGRAYFDDGLSQAQKRDYVAHGLDATDAALRLRPTSVEATYYKSMFLQVQSTLETDTNKQRALMKEASDLEDRAHQLLQRPVADPPAPVRAHPFLDLPPTPPAPPPVPPAPRAARAPLAPVRVGGNILPPRKTKDVPPVYPRVAIASRIQGQVMLEAVIDEQGHVTDLKVLKSIPLLDKAALDAVRQWEYTTTTVDGVAVSVIMTVTVTFTLK